MKILFIGNEISSHTKYGGYVHIKDYPNSDFLNIEEICPFFWKLGKPFKFINYFLAVRKACKMSKNYDIIHSIYEDNYYFPLIYKCKCKSVGTVHLDITGKLNPIRKILLNIVLKKLNYIIVLSTEQKEKFESLGYRCTFIPHGFKKPEYTQIELQNKMYPFDERKINLFFSGNTYRDLNTLESVLIANENNDNIVFHILSQKGDNKIRFEKYKNTIVYDRVSDDFYFTLLSKCDYNFLPLTFSTANNTLLEAQFLGIKSILPTIGGILDYASASNIFYSSNEQVIKIISKLKKSTKSEQIIKDSKKYDWKNIYVQLEDCYINILNNF